MAEAAMQKVSEAAPVPEPRAAALPTAADLARQYGLHDAGYRPALREYVRQVWAYRHFISTFANSRMTASFSGARLGRFWQVLTPLVNAAVYYLIFGVLLKTSDGIDNFIAFLCIGIFLFTFTQTVALAGVRSIISNLGLIRALKFPRASLPLTETLTQIQQLSYSMVVLLGIVLATGEALSPRWLLVLPVLILQSVFNGGLALLLARLGSRATDLGHVLPFAMRTWMYGSGVFYSVADFSGHLPPTLAELVQANPLLVYIELARISLLHSPSASSPTPLLWTYGIIWALFMGTCGFVFFWRGEQEYGRG